MVEMILWDFVNLQLMSGHPDRILFDRRFEPTFVNGAAVLDDKTNPSLLSQDTVDLRDYFERNNVRAVIVYSEPAAKRVQQIMRQIYKLVRGSQFSLFRINGASWEKSGEMDFHGYYRWLVIKKYLKIEPSYTSLLDVGCDTGSDEVRKWL